MRRANALKYKSLTINLYRIKCNNLPLCYAIITRLLKVDQQQCCVSCLLTNVHYYNISCCVYHTFVLYLNIPYEPNINNYTLTNT